MTARRFKFDIRQAGRMISLVLLGLAVLNVGFYLLATRPKLRAYTNLQEGTGPQQEALRSLTAEVEQREQFLEALLTAESDLARIRQEILSTRKERLVDVQQELEQLAKRFSIDVDSVTYDNELLRDAELDKLVMTVPLEGGYANLRKFLQAVEASERFLVVERVALSEGKQGGVMLELSITLTTYFDAPEELKPSLQRDRRGRRSG